MFTHPLWLWRIGTGLLLAMAVVGCDATIAPRQGVPEDTGPRISYDETRDTTWETVTLQTDGASLQVAYPGNWQFRRISERQFILANGENILGRYAQGTLTEPLFADDEVVIDVSFVERGRILAGNEDMELADDATPLGILETVFQSLPPLRQAGVTPNEIQMDGMLGAEETFELEFLEYSVLVMQVSDDYFANVVVANAPDEYDDTWDQVAERLIESFLFSPAGDSSTSD